MSAQAIFIVLTSLLPPSIFCTLFLFYHFIRSAQSRNQPRNHLVICLLIVNFLQEIVEVPPRLYFLLMKIILFPNETYCKISVWLQYTLVSINLLIVAFGSLERYLLVFHSQLLSRHYILFRIFPLLFSIGVPVIFYTIGIVIVQCQTVYNYASVACYTPCFFSVSLAANVFKNIIMICLPVALTILSSSFLLIRVYLQRRKMRRQQHFWKKSLQMILQLLPIIILYLIIWIPMSVLFYFVTFGTLYQRSIVIPLLNNIFANIKYLVNYMYPFLVCFGQPELYKKIQGIFCRWNQHRRGLVYPLAIMQRLATNNNNTLAPIRT